MLTTRPVLFLGEISYSFYSIHAPVLWYLCWAVSGKVGEVIIIPNATAAQGFFFLPSWSLPLDLLLVIAVAAPLHYVLEKPMRSSILVAAAKVKTEEQQPPPALPTTEEQGGERALVLLKSGDGGEQQHV